MPDSSCKTTVFDDASAYDVRHAAGWMDSWPEDKIERVIALIRDALPAGAAKPRILEYGCGAGVFAAAVQKALPYAEVHGCDISTTAIARAERLHPGVRYHHVASPALEQMHGTFDLVYTHHVLEYVQDLPSSLAHMALFVRGGGKLLHIVPCANEGSLEHRISKLTRYGVDGTGCFVCDDSLHARRLNSGQLIDASRQLGLRLLDACFANQFWGGIDYLTNEYHWVLLRWLNPLNGASVKAVLQLLSWLLLLLPLCVLRKGLRYVTAVLARPATFWKKLCFTLLLPVALLLYPATLAINGAIGRLREREWARKRAMPNGSEMYCLFEKS